MIVELSETAANTMLDALAGLMDGGTIELSSDAGVLAVLQLSSPAALMAADGELVFNAIKEEDAAMMNGIASSARIVAADGRKVFSCDVGDEASDAVIKLTTTRIARGMLVRLKSFRLAMP